MFDFLCALRCVLQYRDYRPQPLTLNGVRRWIQQFDRQDRKYIRRLLKSIFYLRERAVREILIEQNTALMKRLAAAGLQPHQLIYVEVHEAGSSSGLMLNILRDNGRLEQRGCRFIHAKDLKGITDETFDAGESALIYVDDFVGSGKQLGDERDFAINYAVGTFSEFLLTPSICEEGYGALQARGIEIFAGHVHMKAERPLHNDSAIFTPAIKGRLRAICNQIDHRAPTGFRNMAVMVVLYRNSPDNVPMLLRGSAGQKPFIGIFPRTTDMPV
jgi:hypothetical protein